MSKTRRLNTEAPGLSLGGPGTVYTPAPTKEALEREALEREEQELMMKSTPPPFDPEPDNPNWEVENATEPPVDEEIPEGVLASPAETAAHEAAKAAVTPPAAPVKPNKAPVPPEAPKPAKCAQKPCTGLSERQKIRNSYGGF